MLRTVLTSLGLSLLMVNFMLKCEVQCSLLGGSPYIEIKENGYDNVVVALHPTLDTNNRQQLIDNLKKLLVETSNTLFSATNNLGYLKNVYILIPMEWSDMSKDGLATFQSFQQPDIMVAPSNPYHGDHPYGLQSSKCGYGGHYVHLTPGFINSLKSSKELVTGAKEVVSAWAQYRYGVFEECGSVGDGVHPHIFLNGSNLAVTGCAAAALKGTFQGDCNYLQNLTDGQCKFDMNQDQSHADPSIMFSAKLTDEPQKFCDDASHDRLSPTKQNILCDRKSTWSVIKSSPDFRSDGSKTNSKVNTKPTFKLVIAVMDKYVLIIDQSINMTKENRFENIRLGVSRLVNHHVPDGLNLGFIAFTKVLEEEKEIISMTENAKKSFLNSIPNSATNEPEININAAIQRGIEMIKTYENRKGNDGRSTLVLITGGDYTNLHQINSLEMCKKLVQSRIRLQVILYVAEKREADQHLIVLQKLTDCSKGHLFVIADIRSDDPYHIVSREIIDTALRKAVDIDHPITAPVQVYERKHRTLEMMNNGSFYVDKTLSGSLTISLSCDDNINLKEIRLLSPSKIKYGKENPKYDWDPAERHVTITLDNEDIKNDIGNWSYTIEWQNAVEHIGIVKVSAIPNEETIRIHCWTEIYNTTSSTIGVVAGQTAVVIYAKLMKGQTPIVDAKVVADIIPPPDNNQQKLHRVQLELFDDGGGDPDVSKHDGIYSRYFTEFTSKPGYYAFRVTATDNVQATILIATSTTTQNSSEPGVCAKNPVTLKATEPFFRSSLGETFYVSKVDYALQDPFPPARIGDLHIAEIRGEAITLSWTAVGNDFDNDKPNDPVRIYDFRRSQDREMMTEENFDQAEIVYIKIRNVRSKLQQNATFKLLEEGVPFYLAGRAFDGTSYGRISNVITVTQGKKQDLQEASITPGAVAGIAIAAIILLTIVAVVCIITRRKSRKTYTFRGFSLKKKKKYPDNIFPTRSVDEIRPMNEEKQKEKEATSDV